MRTKNAAYYSRLTKFITDYKAHNGCAPTVYEIADGVGIPKSTVSRYLAAMREEALIDYSGRRSIVTAEEKKQQASSVRVPVLGRIACGIPKFADENIEEYVSLPVSLFGHGEYFLLRAAGDSMINAGIDDGDLVFIRQQNYASPGQIVVALLEDEATLKRYFPEPENGRIRLQPENEHFAPIYTQGCMIQGVAVKVLKDLV